jgi:hypothetical protein
MSSSGLRKLMVAVGIAVVFLAVAAVLLKVLPAPHSPTDYLVIGASATMVSMVALFVVVINGFVKNPNVFYKKRPKDGGNQEG